MNPAIISVVICTHERSAALARCLAALAQQRIGLDIIVVDSGSREPEAVLIGEISRRHAARHIRLSDAGLSRARNAGLAAARAGWIAYVDDDAVPAPDWAEKLNDCILATPDAAAIGGAILPDWDAALPLWWPRALVATLTVLEWDRAGRVGGPDLPRNIEPYGANIAFHKETLWSFGGFPECLGRSGAALLSNEETYVLRRLHTAGRVILFAPDIIVRHHIERDRLTPEWLLRRQYWSGISEAVMLGALGQVRLPKALRMAVKVLLLAPFGFWPPRSTARLESRCSGAFARGFLRGLMI
jgi:glycosyltransferase involved in cell wall biosynthesis